MQEPDMIGIIDIETMMQLQCVEMIFPAHPDLRSDVYPETLDPNIMNTPECYEHCYWWWW